MPYVDHPLPEAFQVQPLVPLKLKRLPGRPKGAIAKLTRDIKQGIVDAATNIGRNGHGEGGLTGFLEDLALNHKRAFAGLLAKALPLQITGDGIDRPSPVAINIIGVPHDHYLSQADIAKLKGETMEPPPEQYQPPIEPLQIEAPAEQLTALEAKLLAMGHDQLLELARTLDVGT